jgi:hypothetical protein
LTRKVEKLKGELELVKEKIRVIDAANAEEDPQA